MNDELPANIVGSYFRLALGEQRKSEPLSSTMLYLIHTNKYDKPYSKDVKEQLDKYKCFILSMFKNNALNVYNVFDVDYIYEQISKFLNKPCDEIDEHEYNISFNELINENVLSYYPH